MAEVGFESWQDNSELAWNHCLGFIQQKLENGISSLLLLFPKSPRVAFEVESCLVLWIFSLSAWMLICRGSSYKPQWCPHRGLKHYGSVVPIHTWPSLLNRTPRQWASASSTTLMLGLGSSQLLLPSYWVPFGDCWCSFPQAILNRSHPGLHPSQGAKAELDPHTKDYSGGSNFDEPQKDPSHSCLRVKGSCCDFLNAEYWQNVGRVLVSSSGLTGGFWHSLLQNTRWS